MLAFVSLPPKMSSTIAPISLLIALVVASWTTARCLIRFRIKSACQRTQSASAGLSNTFPATVQDMRVDHCRLNVLMAQQFLNRADVVAKPPAGA